MIYINHLAVHRRQCFPKSLMKGIQILLKSVQVSCKYGFMLRGNYRERLRNGLRLNLYTHRIKPDVGIIAFMVVMIAMIMFMGADPAKQGYAFASVHDLQIWAG